MSTSSPSRRRIVAFALLLAGCVAVAVVALVAGAKSGGSKAKATAGAANVLPAAKAKGEPMVVYTVDDGHRRGSGQVAIAPLATPNEHRTLTSLACDRVYFSAAGAGICLARRGGFAAGYEAKMFGPDLKVRHTLPLDGIPSRTRVSPDGRYAATTLFVTGDSYADAGSFSTRTTIIDLKTGRTVANLEDFVVLRGQRRITAIDVNFWGVTFARDSDRFFATVATGGKTYLIEGSVRAREAHVIQENVECPSLSPDGTRIAFKKRTDSNDTPWHLTVLDLATMRETPLTEQRSVDDQVEWLDDKNVLYGVDGAIWTARADGTGEPTRFIDHASSPAVVRY